MKGLIITAIISGTILSAPAQAFDLKKAVRTSGGALVKAGTMSEKTVINDSRNAVKHMDAKAEAVPAASDYQERLMRIVGRVDLPEIKNVDFNFKVYKTEDGNLNAFATPDGSIRFHSALMDLMTDEQILAVLGHEIGHVVEKHSFNQMRKSLLTVAALRGAAGQSAIGSEAYNIGLGNLSEKYLTSSFSRKHELSADKYALGVLKGADADLNAMKGAIKVLQEAYGEGGGMLASHPSNPNRIKKLDKAVKKMK